MLKNKFISILVVFTLVLNFSLICFAAPEDETTAAQTTEPIETTAVATSHTASAATTHNNSNRGESKSSDASLKSLTVVGKTSDNKDVAVSISPAFSPNQRTYNINVPNEVIRLEIQVVANNDKAKVEIPSGFLKIDIGDKNRSFVYVTAESGVRFTYQINTNRSEETTSAETTSEEAIIETTTELISETATETVSEVATVAPVQTGINKYTKLGIVFGCAGGVMLIIGIISVIVKKKNNGGDNDEENSI